MTQTPLPKKAWLDRVLHDHVELKKGLSELRDFLDEPRPEIGMRGYHTWAAACSARLVELHDKLFRHFRFEEQDGILRDQLRVHPRAQSKVEAIEAEHVEMLTQLRGILSDVLVYSEGKPPADSRIRQRIVAVMDQLQAHEEAEMDLIQRVMYREVGAGD